LFQEIAILSRGEVVVRVLREDLGSVLLIFRVGNMGNAPQTDTSEAMEGGVLDSLNDVVDQSDLGEEGDYKMDPNLMKEYDGQVYLSCTSLISLTQLQAAKTI
jgi:hypothetical protein